MLKLLNRKQEQETAEKAVPYLFLKRHYNVMIIVIIIVFIIGGFYFIFTATFDTLISPTTINPGSVISQQQKINISQYEECYERLQNKQSPHTDKTIPRIFR